MGKAFITFLTVFWGLTASATLTKKQLSLIDQDVLKTEIEGCSTAKDKRDWVTAEVTKLTSEKPSSGRWTSKETSPGKNSLKVSGSSVKGYFYPGSPSPSSQGADIVDVGEGTLKDLSQVQGENKFWLVHVSETIPIEILAAEAKNKKSLGLLIAGYGSKDAPAKLPVPVYVLTQEDLPDPFDKGVFEERPDAKKSYDWVTLKVGPRQLAQGIVADLNSCTEVSRLLALMAWSKTAEVKLNGTIFAFVENNELGPLAEIDHTLFISGDTLDLAKTAKDIVESDENKKSIQENKKRLDQNIKDLASLYPYFDKQNVLDFQNKIKTIAKRSPDDLDRLFKLNDIFKKDRLVPLAKDLSTLKLVHTLVQKGSWDKARKQFEDVADYSWVGDVDQDVFINYKQGLKDNGVSPDLWRQLQSPPTEIDHFLETSEAEIDRLTGRLSDIFTKSYKTVENLENL